MTDISDKEQYDRLSQDWRQIHNVIWGIPAVAISIITGVIIAAYNVQGWPRILVLGLGSIFLFSMTVEIVKKRLTMDAMSARMQRIERIGKSQLSYGEFPSKTIDLVIEQDKLTMEKREAEMRVNDEAKASKNREGTTDLPYIMFKLSHARTSLTYVLFAAAILASALTYWEYLKYVDYEWWMNLLGIFTVIVISIAVAVDSIINYGKYEKAISHSVQGVELHEDRILLYQIDGKSYTPEEARQITNEISHLYVWDTRVYGEFFKDKYSDLTTENRKIFDTLSKTKE